MIRVKVTYKALKNWKYCMVPVFNTARGKQRKNLRYTTTFGK